MSSNTNTNTNTNTTTSSSSTASTSNSGARHFRHSQSSYSEASFVLNGDGTWSSQEKRGSQVGEKKDHFSRVQEGTYKKNEESKSYDFTVTKDEHKSSNPDDRIEDHTGKVISRPIGDIEHFGGFRSLMYDFPMLSLPHSLLSSASSSGSAAAAIEQKKQ